MAVYNFFALNLHFCRLPLTEFISACQACNEKQQNKTNNERLNVTTFTCFSCIFILTLSVLLLLIFLVCIAAVFPMLNLGNIARVQHDESSMHVKGFMIQGLWFYVNIIHQVKFVKILIWFIKINNK